jgi:hypothetical protein
MGAPPALLGKITTVFAFGRDKSLRSAKKMPLKVIHPMRNLSAGSRGLPLAYKGFVP